MDRQVQHFEIGSYISDFILAIKNESSDIKIPQQKLKELKIHLDKEILDYYSLQSIIDILVSISVIPGNERINRLISELTI